MHHWLRGMDTPAYNNTFSESKPDYPHPQCQLTCQAKLSCFNTEIVIIPETYLKAKAQAIPSLTRNKQQRGGMADIITKNNLKAQPYQPKDDTKDLDLL